MQITIDQLQDLGLTELSAVELLNNINTQLKSTPAETWHALSSSILSTYPFKVHLFLFTSLFPDWRTHPENAPAWMPTQQFVKTTNIYQFMTELDIHDVSDLHTWSINAYENFWHKVVTKLHIIFKKNPEKVCDLHHGIESPSWFPDGELNITDSCFMAPSEKTALIYQDENHNIKQMSYGELNELSNQVANGLIDLGYSKGDAIGIAMPMNQYAIAAYIGIIKIGGIVVSIADSFSSQEISTRLKIANTKAIFTQDFTFWNGKKFPLYEKILETDADKIFLIMTDKQSLSRLRPEDCSWENLLLSQNKVFTSTACSPMDYCNILFSSGTTADPKAIPWNHTTPIKVASDAYLHQDIRASDVLAWPTNLGWMMGPWLLFAAFINQATIAIYTEAPKGEAFGQFIQEAQVTMLGVVPTLVALWRQTKCMEKLNWHSIQKFSSTGECSNAEDMLYLMSLAGYKPIIEYCGGTEIGGAYITSTLIQNNYPSLFSTPAMGLNFSIIDENGSPSHSGEVAIIPPSIGLSTELINANHHEVYFADMSKTANGESLRRHSDVIKQLANNYYCILGRNDDAMNLGGIKISAAEIERAISGLPKILETAAIAIHSLDSGPDQLVIYVATQTELNKNEIMTAMQKKINANLNPLFKIDDLIFVSELPKTASNKIMRRMLRKQYQGNLER